MLRTANPGGFAVSFGAFRCGNNPRLCRGKNDEQSDNKKGVQNEVYLQLSRKSSHK